MRNVMRYSGIVTKVAAMRAKLLKPQDYEQLASMDTVTDIIEYLKQTKSYGKFITQMDESLYHRGNIEKVLIQSLYDDYTRLYRFADMQQKDFLKIFMKRYEVDLVRYCLRIVFNHSNVPFDLNYKKPFFDKYSKLSIDKLITSTNIDELVDNLRGSEYYEALKPIRDSGAATLFDYDQALELYYFTNYWRRGRKVFSGKSRERFSRDVGIKMDLMNIQWAYRAKQYYRMLPAEIYALTLPYHFHLSTEEFKAIVEAPNVEEMKKQIENTYYGTHVHMKEGQSIEKSIKDILRDLYISDRQKDPYSDATMHAFLFLKEQEIDKLTTALECIRYGLTRQEILTYLGGESK